MECALRSHDVERAANNRAVGAQPAPLVARFLTSLCGEWWSEPSRPQSLCALADECRAPRNAVATATGEGACFGWSCPRATRARSRQYVLRPPCLWHVLQPQTEVRIARSGCRRRGACHMPLPGGGTTRIKRCQSIWSNHTPRSMSIQWAMVHFGGMGSPNIYSASVDSRALACAAGSAAHPRRCPCPLPHGLGPAARRLGGRRRYGGRPAGGGPCPGGPRPSRRAGLPPFAHDGTERRIARPQDPPQQAACYSGKKKDHTVKNVLLVNALLVILFLDRKSTRLNS